MLETLIKQYCTIKSVVIMYTGRAVIRPYSHSRRPSAIGNQCNKLLLGMKLYVMNTDKRSDTNSEMSHYGYTKYKHSWNAVRLIKLVDQN